MFHKDNDCKGSVKEKISGRNFSGLGAKTKSLAVNRQF
jgi:hypothetical protein